MNIPKILHRVWVGDTPMPQESIDFYGEWKNMHPDWDFKLWGENDSKYPQLMAQCQTPAGKSNILRFEKLFDHGGVYVDTDVKCLKSFDSLLGFGAFCGRESPIGFGTAVMAASQGHPWIGSMIDEMPLYAHRPPPWGPTLLTAMTIQRQDVKVFEKETFYPFSWDFTGDINSIDFSESYCIHFWTLSWSKTWRRPWSGVITSF